MPAAAGAPDTPDPDSFFNTLDGGETSPEAGAGAPDGGEKPPGEKPAARTPPAPAKPAPKSGEKPAPAAGEKPKPAAAAPVPGSPKELRVAYERSQNELKAANAEKVRLLQQVETLRKTPQSNPAELQAVTQQLAQEQKARQDLETELKYLRYEHSEEYKQKYEQPWNAAQKRAFDTVKDLMVKVQGADGTVSERNATAADFHTVFNLPEGAAWRKARELFGEDAPVVMTHYTKLNEILTASREDINKYRTEGAERDKQEAARKAQEKQADAAMGRKADEAYLNHAKWGPHFKPVEGDEAGNKDLEMGFRRANVDLDTLSPGNRALAKSWLKHAAAAFPRLVSKVTAYEARIADLEAKLKEFEDSGPGPGEEAGGGRPPQANDRETDPLKALDRALG
ncbi:MAG TPA: hypothetical protein VFU31_21140 [Candidatus Binatia bacterium]|nr:hypothetical protein [Candidatus Binatia bacterium]